MITTSLTGGSDRPSLWNLAPLDLVQYHSYGLDQPSLNLASIADSMRQRYGKPVLIGGARYRVCISGIAGSI